MMSVRFQHTAARRRLGWGVRFTTSSPTFQHTAARRRLVQLGKVVIPPSVVSTHSRPKAAGLSPRPSASQRVVSTHSRPKAAGREAEAKAAADYVSTHSRPKAAGKISLAQLKAAMFQHTAARRRLEAQDTPPTKWA